MSADSGGGSEAPGSVLPVASGRVTLRRVGRLLRPRTPIAVLAAGAMVASVVCGIAVPLVIGAIVDTVVAGGPSAAIVRNGFVLVGLALGGAGCTVAAGLLVARFGEPAVAELRESVMDRALSLESGVVESSGAGDLLARLGRDVRALSEVVNAVLVRFTGAGLTVLLSLGGLALVDPRFALAAGCAVPVQVWATLRFTRRAPALYARIARAEGAESQQVLESVGGADTVRALGLGREHLDRIAERAEHARDLQLSAVRLRTVFSQRLNLAEFVGVTAILLLGYALVASGEVTEGQATAAALMFLRLFGPINTVLGLVDDVLSAFAGLTRLVGVLEAPAEPDRPAGPVPADAGVRLAGVGFGYRTGHEVVRGVDLNVAPGERLAVVGSSGAGKTTLGQLVAGLRSPDRGRVLIGGVSLGEIGPRERRRLVSVVTQEVHVFQGPLRDDLSLAAPEAEEPRLRGALAAVGALTWVDGLPEGLDTVVGSGGLELSPVRAQQLALARLLLAAPAVAVLDEATAEADSRGARELERAAEAATAGRTTLVIAHRLDQAARCDRVAVMERGRIVELGRHEDLVAAGGVYARLWSAWDTRGSS